MSIDLKNLTIRKAHESLVKGDFAAVELAQSYLENIKSKNAELNVYLEVYDDVLDQARQADEKIKSGKATLMTGIPIAVKDNILIKGKRAGSASKILEGYKATYDATVIKKLKDEGAVFLGRTNMDEFAMGSSTENSAYGVTKNPHDTSRVAGGSSGGSAVAVASDMALCALGSDTGGSVRQPASFCGVVGFKPSYGAVSRYGLMAMGSSLDVIGTFGKTIEDAKILFDAIRGKDSMDSTSFDIEEDNKKKDIVELGVFNDFSGGISKEMINFFDDALRKIDVDKNKKVLVGVSKLELKEAFDLALPAYYIIMPAEVSSNLSRFDGVKYGLKDGEGNLLDNYLNTRGKGFGNEARRRIILGTYVLSKGYYDSYYGNALKARDFVRKSLSDAFQTVDLIVTLTSPSPAFKIGEKINDPIAMYLEDILTVTSNIAGVPSVSIPAGTLNVDGKELPVGIQLIAPYGKEEMLLRASVEVERILNNKK